MITYSFEVCLIKTGCDKNPSHNSRQRLDRRTPQHGTTSHFSICNKYCNSRKWFAYQVASFVNTLACSISSLVSVGTIYSATTGKSSMTNWLQILVSTMPALSKFRFSNSKSVVQILESSEPKLSCFNRTPVSSRLRGAIRRSTLLKAHL